MRCIRLGARTIFTGSEKIQTGWEEWNYGVDRANISRLSGCRKWLIGAFIDPVAVGCFSGRLPDADMVRRSHDKTEGSKEIGSLEQSTTLGLGDKWPCVGRAFSCCSRCQSKRWVSQPRLGQYVKRVSSVRRNSAANPEGSAEAVERGAGIDGRPIR